jgi:hypothetical protein
MRVRTAALTALVLLLFAVPGHAQDVTILLPVDSIERLLRHEPFEILDKRGSRFEGDRTSRAALTYADGTMLAVKWAPAPPGGDAFNNSPRHETAAYELQKMFLDDSEIVVPPTVIRAVPLPWYRDLDPAAEATFGGTTSTIVALQYWLNGVTPHGFWDPDRFERDLTYARHLANFNILTYLIRHGDANVGNFLIAESPLNPRVFSVDNGVAFRSRDSDRSDEWRLLRVRRLPASTVARLRAITEADLIRRLETVAQFRVVEGGELERAERGPNLRPDRGIRRHEDLIQLGLTRREIGDVWRRLQHLLREVDRGRIELF